MLRHGMKRDLLNFLGFWWRPTSKNAYYILRRAAIEMDRCDLADARELLSWKIEIKDTQERVGAREISEALSRKRVKKYLAKTQNKNREG